MLIGIARLISSVFVNTEKAKPNEYFDNFIHFFVRNFAV